MWLRAQRCILLASIIQVPQKLLSKDDDTLSAETAEEEGGETQPFSSEFDDISSLGHLACAQAEVKPLPTFAMGLRLTWLVCQT